MAQQVRHIRTGLFLGPTTSKYNSNLGISFKTNLRFKGKIYPSITLETAGKWYRDYYNEIGKRVKFRSEDFEITNI